MTGDAIDRSLDIMRKRVDQIGVAEPSLQRSGADQIDVSLPDVKNADEAASQVGTTAQMWFYDWEGSVLGPNCKPDPQNPNVTGGQAAGDASIPPALSLFDAVTRGAKCPRTNTGKESSGDKFYLVDKERKQVLAGPDESRADLQKEALNKKIPFDAKQIVKVPQGTVIVRAEQPDPKGKPPPAWYVLADQPILGGTDIKNPEQGFDNGPGESGQPNVTFDFTGHGAGVWSKFTRKLSQRGQEFSLGAQGDAVQPALRHRAGQRADLGPADRLAPVPRRPGRRPGVARSRAASPSTPPSSWPTCSRRAPCRSSSSSSRPRRCRPRWASRRSTRASSRAPPASSSSRSSC